MALLLLLTACTEAKRPAHPASADSGRLDADPIVTFTSPLDGDALASDVVVEVTATDDSAVALVHFFQDGALLAVSTSAPYTFQWTASTAAESTHTLTAVAADDVGHLGEASVTVTVDRTAPAVRLDSPAPGDTVSYAVALGATVDERGGIESVAFSVDGVTLETLTSEPWEATWDASDASGSYDISVLATDLAGNTATARATVEVLTALDVRIRDPDDGDTLAGQVAVTGLVEGGRGEVWAALSLDGSLVAIDEATPFGWTADTCLAAQGEHTFAVGARDAFGAGGRDTIDVFIDQALEIELSPPGAPLGVTESSLAWVSDDDSIVSVVFAVDGTDLATATVGSSTGSCSLTCFCEEYGASWDTSGLTDGSHTLTVTVTNSAGAVATDSAFISTGPDADADGYLAEGAGGDDCDDGHATVNPGQAELCTTAFDDNCDGSTDATDASGCTTWYADADGDGYGNPDTATCDCSAPADYVAVADDCDDAVEFVNPAGEEACGNGYDDDCDGSVGDCGIEGTISLSSADAKLTGEVSGDEVGDHNAIADLNADGYDDLILATSTHGSGGTGAGATYVVYGPVSVTASLATADVKVTGNAYDRSGLTLATGDFDGDGTADLALGAPNNDPAGSSAGAAYILYSPLGTSDLSGANVKVTGAADGDLAGYGLGAADVNNDGIDDLLVGASGQDEGAFDAGAVYAVYGPGSSTTTSLDAAPVFVYGEAEADLVGTSAIVGADVNGDGLTDLLIGSYRQDASTGAAYLVLGPTPSVLGLVAADAKLTGEATGASAGYSLAAGDVDQDGYDDPTRS